MSSEVLGLILEMDAVKGLLQEKGLTLSSNNKFVDTMTEINRVQSIADELNKKLEEQGTVSSNDMVLMNETLNTLKQRMEEMALNLETLAAEVGHVQTVQASAVTMLQNLTDELTRVSAELALQATPDTTELDALIADMKTSTDALAGAVANSADVHAVETVILHADEPTVPTVEVTMPAVLPPAVEVSAELAPGVTTVDPASPEPQVIISVEPAPAVDAAAPAPAEAPVSEIIATPEGQTDVEVSAPAADHAEILADTGVDIVEEAVAAIEATPEVVAAPEVVAEPEVTVIMNADNPAVPTVEVTMPEILPAEVIVSAEPAPGVTTIDPASTEPQVAITVEAAPAADPAAPAAPMVSEVIATDPGLTDVTVSAPADEHAAAITDLGVDIVKEAVAAFEATPEVTAEPEAPAQP